MWGETADTSVVLQTIWPRAAAAAGKNSIRHAVSVYSVILVSLFLVSGYWVQPRSHRVNQKQNQCSFWLVLVFNFISENNLFGFG